MWSLIEEIPAEVQEEVVLKLEVEDVISLGSSCTTLASVVGQDKIWRVVLAKTQLVEDGMVNEIMVRKITTFLDDNSVRAIFSLLHQRIYERYPTSGQGSNIEENIAVSFPSSPQLHSVSILELQLLALTGRKGARHMVNMVQVSVIPTSLLLSQELIAEQITNLDLGASHAIQRRRR